MKAQNGFILLEKTKDNQKEIMDINTLYTTIEHLKQTKEEYHFNN